MLKLVGTENGIIKDEKVIIDDNDRLSGFAIQVIVIDLLLDIFLFFCLSKLKKKK